MKSIATVARNVIRKQQASITTSLVPGAAGQQPPASSRLSRSSPVLPRPPLAPASRSFTTTPPRSDGAAKAESLYMSTLPLTLAGLQSTLKAAKSRDIDCEVIANLVNEKRRYGSRAEPRTDATPAISNKALVEGITDHEFAEWNRAQGLSDADVTLQMAAAFRSGLAQPSGSALTNAASYIAAPLAGALAGDPFVAAAVGLTSAAVAPFVISYIQPHVVGRCELFRERNGPTVALAKGEINDDLTLLEAAKRVEEKTELFLTAGIAFNHAFLPHKGSDLNDLDPTQLTQLRELAEALLTANTAMQIAHRDALATQGSHERHQVGNATQVMPRTMRPIAAGAIGLLTGVSPEQAAATGQRERTVTNLEAAGIQSGLSVLISFAQHWAAAEDERNKQMFQNKLNLLYADIYTPAGQTKFNLGQPVTADDIDSAKVRKLMQSPAEAIVGRVAAAVQDHKKQIDKDLLSTETSAHTNEAEPSPEGAPTAEQQARTREDLAQASEECRQDLEHLKKGNIEAISENGLARKLLIAGFGSFESELTQAVTHKKANAPGEFQGQVIQRLGQNLHLGIAGSFFASNFGRFTNLMHGGASQTPSGVIFGSTVVAGGGAFLGAVMQFTGISEKFNAKANHGTSSGFTQFWRTAVALPLELLGMHTSTKVVNKDVKIIQLAQLTTYDANAVLEFMSSKDSEAPTTVDKK